MNNKHTPGPWKAVRYTSHPHIEIFGVIGEGSTTVQRVAYLQDHLTENDANARLIESAPEMYEALKNVVACYRTFRNVPKKDQEWTPTDDEALAAAFQIIDKIEGK
jgi:predicted acyltransferase